MSPKLEVKILQTTNELKDIVECANKHFSFLVDKTKIVSIGWNTFKTHPRAFKYNYRFNSIHSELAALLKFKGRKKELRNLILINTRINSLGEIGYSKPCEKCWPWLSLIGLKAIWYTNRQGIFIKA